MYDYLIIGAGPAGLQMAYFLDKAGKSYLVLERENQSGSFFAKFPRQRQLISINKKYTGIDDHERNLRWDWNSLLCDDEEISMKNYSDDYLPKADRLVDYLNDFSKHYDLNISYNTEVRMISKADHFKVIDQKGNIYEAGQIVVSTGMFKPNFPKEIEGIEHVTETYSNMSGDPKDFIDQKVLIIGKGNSGFETADSLLSTTSLIHIASRSPLKLAWKTHYVGHLRAVNNHFLDTYQLKSQNGVINADIKKIRRTEDGKFLVSFGYKYVDESETLEYDRIILAAGFCFDDSIFDQTCKPELCIDDRFPKQTSSWESTNVKGLYFNGTLTHMRDFKKKQSGFIHGFRYNAKALFDIMNYEHDDVPFPSQQLTLDPEAITKFLIGQINQTSALWQQTGFLGDVLVIDENRDTATYYEGLPVDYIHEGPLGENEHYYVVTLEWGQKYFDECKDIFAMSRVNKNDVTNADKSAFIHPVIRKYNRGQEVGEHHIIEDFESEWLEEVHVAPLLSYLELNLEFLEAVVSHG